MNALDQLYDDSKGSIEIFIAGYFKYLGEVLAGIDSKAIGRFIEILLSARKAGATIYFIGNGGSAATASHFANDIAIGTNAFDKPFRAISLTDNQAIITAISNDFGYDGIFERQLRLLGRTGDVVVGISASGNSINLIKAFDYAKSVGIKTVAITGFDGGKMKQIADESVHVPTGLKEYGPAEDAHMVLDHLVGSYLTRLIRST